MDRHDSPPLPPELEDRVAHELEQDEQLVWTGQPRTDLATRPAYFLVPFGIFFAGFALVWIVIAFFLTAGLMAPCGLPFIAIGIWLVCSPIWLRSRARRTIYALTDRRAIVWEPGWFGNSTVRSYSGAGLGHIARIERRDGAGDLVLEEFTTYGRDSQGHTTSQTTRRGFLAIDDVRGVEELVRRTLLSGR